MDWLGLIIAGVEELVKSKLCHRKFAGLSSFASLTTRFPDSKSSATGFSAVLDEFDNQTIELLLLYRIS
uniref:Uncharacterized protein n=1 Tax=Salix viminalis TaxID=40686 RepID=A0A6N2N8V5_SALVM